MWAASSQANSARQLPGEQADGTLRSPLGIDVRPVRGRGARKLLAPQGAGLHLRLSLEKFPCCILDGNSDTGPFNIVQREEG